MRRQSLIATLLASIVAAGAMASPACAGGGGSPGVRVRPDTPPLYGRSAPQRGWDDGGRMWRDDGWRRDGYGYGTRPQIYCDAYGRCFQRVDPFARQGFGARPPGWADDLPGRSRSADRFVRPRSSVVCDQATSICYKRGRIDKSETRSVFGGRAADRADDLRDRFGSGQVFVPERGTSCNAAQQVCYDSGVPDFSLTRRYFGDDAASRLD